MPDDLAKKRIISYRTQIIALNILRAKKSQIVIKSALWSNIYQAQLEIARLERKIADIDRARRDIIIVAVTGIASCIGAFAVSQIVARSAGVAYKSFSMATSAYTAATAATLPTGTTIVVQTSRALAPTLAQWLLGQIGKGLFIGVPVGLLLTRLEGDSLLTRILKMIDHKLGAVPFSEDEFTELRDALAQHSVGDERFQSLISDPNTRRETLLPLMAAKLKEMTSQYISEAVMGIPPPANGLLLMNDLEFAKWYRRFRRDVDTYIQKTYSEWSREDLKILRNTLYWHFWNDVKNQLNDIDRGWHDNIVTLKKAIVDEQLSVRELLGGGGR